jgi:hypothetical protein
VKEAPLSLPKRTLPRFAILFLAAAATMLQTREALCQITVDLSIKRTIYIAYEPLLATVRITNLTGNRVLFADVEGKKWFGFQIQTLDGRPIPPIDPNYEIDPIQVGPGESITRTVNLTQLYPISDFGSYRIRASVHAPELSGYFSSPPLTVEITEGRLLWQQTVGVPGPAGTENGTRTISLLSHRLSEHTDLYLRIEDKTSGIIYCTHRLGDFISYGKPEIQLDATNTIHVLQNNIPREFIYSKVGLDGKTLDRVTLSAPKDRPRLVRSEEGTVSVAGGFPFDPRATPTPGLIPKLSERPVPMPTPEQAPSPAAKGKAKPAASPKSQAKAKQNPTPSPVKVD